MATVTAKKTSLENEQLRNRDYLTIRPVARKGHWAIAHGAKSNGLWILVPSCSHSVCDVGKIQYNSIGARAVQLNNCFAEDETGLFIGATCTCSTLIFPHSTNRILTNLWRCQSLPFAIKAPYFLSYSWTHSYLRIKKIFAYLWVPYFDSEMRP